MHASWSLGRLTDGAEPSDFARIRSTTHGRSRVCVCVKQQTPDTSKHADGRRPHPQLDSRLLLSRRVHFLFRLLSVESGSSRALLIQRPTTPHTTALINAPPPDRSIHPSHTTHTNQSQSVGPPRQGGGCCACRRACRLAQNGDTVGERCLWPLPLSGDHCCARRSPPHNHQLNHAPPMHPPHPIQQAKKQIKQLRMRDLAVRFARAFEAFGLGKAATAR